MVYDTISDNLVQIGLSIAVGTSLSYDIVLKKHTSKIREFTVQFANAPIAAQDVVFTDMTSNPNIQLNTILGIAANTVFTVVPTPFPNTCGRVIRITTTPNLIVANVLYVKMTFDTQGDS